MRFGVFFLLHSPGARPAAAVYGQALEQMTYADELGFDSVWIAEHHFSNYGYCPNPLTLAVKVAERTKRVRIGTAVLVLPFWHPLRLAEEVALADVLTEGRLEVGVARGYQKYEFDRWGLSIEDSRSLSDETLDVLLKALTTTGFSHEGAHYQVPEATTYPKPVQQPHPPVWVGTASEESIERAVRRGLSCFTAASAMPFDVPKRTFEVFKAKREELGADVEFAVQQHVNIAPTDAEAERRVEHSYWHYRQSNRLRNATERVVRGVAAADPLDDEPAAKEMLERWTIAGSPATVREQIAAYRESMDIAQLNCLFALGELDNETVKASMRLFAEQVMPHFK